MHDDAEQDLKNLKILILTLLFALSVQPTLADITNDVRKQTAKLLKAGEYEQAYLHAQQTVDYRNSYKKKRNIDRTIKLFIDKYPESLPYIIKVREDRIASISGPKERFILEHKKIYHLWDLKLISREDKNALIDLLGIEAARSNKSGEAQFLLTDGVERFQSLQQPDAAAIIFLRSVEELAKTDDCCVLLRKILEQASKKGPYSDEYSVLQGELDNIDFPMKILKAQVAELFPAYAEREVEEREIVVRIVGDSSDEFLLMGVREALATDPMFRVTEEDEPNSFLLILKDTTIVEREIPERTQTVRYSYWDVSPLQSALWMPKGASFVFDEITGGSDARYSGIVLFSRNGGAQETERLSGKVDARYSYCQDPRVVNVFGGVQPANFVPNADFDKRCPGWRPEAGNSRVYDDAIQDLVSKIKKLGPFSELLPDPK